MRRIITSEWLKLRRRGMFGVLAAVLVAMGLHSWFSITTASQRGSDGLRVAALEKADGLARMLERSSGLLGFVAFSVFAAALANEYHHGTLRNLLVREPRRTRLLAGRFVATTVAAVTTVVVALAAAVPVALLAASSKGITHSGWFTSAGLAALAHTVANISLSVIGWGALGTAFALVLRSPVAAIGVGVIYAGPFEGIVSNLFHSSARWLPGQLLSTIASGGDSTASYAAAAVTLALYGVVLGVAGATLFARRDVAT
jgi:hypothetical protein